MTTYSVEEYAVQVCGDASPASVRWLVTRLRSGALPGYKANRRWRATGEQIAEALVLLAPAPRPAALPVVPSSSMTRTSRRRLAG